MDLQSIHAETIKLMKEANEQISSAEDHFWYNGEFYSGSTTPELLFVGFNPGYGRTDWPNRSAINYNPNFIPNEIKYIEEQKGWMASQIYFLLGPCMGRAEEEVIAYLRGNVAETNFIHFNTPDIPIYNKSLRCITPELAGRLHDHFSESFRSIIEIANPKLLLINGKSTYDQLSMKMALTPLEIVQKDDSGQIIYGVSSYNGIKILVTKHLSWIKSDDQLGSIGAYIKSVL